MTEEKKYVQDGEEIIKEYERIGEPNFLFYPKGYDFLKERLKGKVVVDKAWLGNHLKLLKFQDSKQKTISVHLRNHIEFIEKLLRG